MKSTKPITKDQRPNQRLFVSSDLSSDVLVTLEEGQAHYLVHVLRLSLGVQVLVFNGRDGEWLAELKSISKKSATMQVSQQTRPQDYPADLTLYLAPVKGDRTDFIVEKATELGVAHIRPVLTDRTIVRKLNQDRLSARAVEAAEQCGRLSVPEVAPPVPLSALLCAKMTECVVLFADEAGGCPSIQVALADRPLKVGLLIGPEGGFTPTERRALRACSHIRPVSLGPRILRADTACYAGLVLIQNCWGDWAYSLSCNKA
ncbi:16S rRNA (uracil(1498)-N(3))-methyltransferase [Candidatus Phycosocius spiralis]|uniref:Ribosomal RNA small subunit methyltransferase E n=1 Tax=Candidatus Phycosocius spiralis TaxID=2815099 RepID=A0ABQ4PWV0_9PROT|nr:16S rRNA (uracil(1498)-N(3))-methyltransferase [Candidatus Phycosocius spiralis]GIU67492.1 ribosomal RNA small subunit methyltransferase E [Candidatus Phycosocius spiralis]